MYYLAFDTETSGLPDWKKPLEHDAQPFVLEFGFIFAEDRRPLMKGSVYVNWFPFDVQIHPKAAEANGLTTTFLEQVGVTPRAVFNLIGQMLAKAETIVGHNLDFDVMMLRIMAAKLERLEALDSVLQGKGRFCTQKQGTSVTRIPKRDGDHRSYNDSPWKYPKLTELHEFLFKQPFADAHTALADTEACWACYWGIQDFIAGVGSDPLVQIGTPTGLDS